jgi:outer membrane OprD family porin
MSAMFERHEPLRTRSQSLQRSERARWLSAATALLVVAMYWCGPASADDAPPPPPLPAPLEALLAPVKEALAPLPPFLRDTDVRLHFRTYYLNRMTPDGTENEALAFGGLVGYKSGWLLDTFAMGATFYGSAPLYAPADKDGTLLLQPGQKGYYVPGEAWGALRYGDYALLKGYRQLVDQSYINPQDNRMTPNTFEGLTLGGKVGFVEYLTGYLWNMKPRNSDTFVSMSSAAGVKGKHDGVVLAGVRLTPLRDLRIELSNQYGLNLFNTLFAQADYLLPLTKDWKLHLGAQITDQRAVGDAFLRNTAGKKYWQVKEGDARLDLIYGDLTLTAAFSITGTGNTLQTPWGADPGYLSLIDRDFDRPGEKAYMVGAAYNFSKLVQGLSANVALAWGLDVINPKTLARAPNEAEYDTTVDYRPAFQRPFFLRGLWFRVRADIVDQQDAPKLGYQFRLILNWDRDLI